jgi:hypothetical protein
MLKDKKTLSLKSAMKLFEQLDTIPASEEDVEAAMNTILNSNDIAHMSRKGLYNVVLFLVQNIERCRIESKAK